MLIFGNFGKGWNLEVLLFWYSGNLHVDINALIDVVDAVL